MSASSVYILDEKEDHDYDGDDVGADVDVEDVDEDVDDDDDDEDDDDEGDDDDDEGPVSDGGNSQVSAENVYTQIKQDHDIMQGPALQMCKIDDDGDDDDGDD